MHRTVRLVPRRRPRRPTTDAGCRHALGVATLGLTLALAGCTASEDSGSDGASIPGTAATRSTEGAPPQASTEPAEPTQPAEPAGPTPDATLPPADDHSAVGALPDGFPSDLLPVPAGAEILVATFAPEAQAGPQQPYTVSLNVRTSASVEEVLGLYRSSLTAAGFTEGAAAATGSLTAESTFSRSAGEEVLVVGVLDRDGVRTVTVGGRVRSAA